MAHIVKESHSILLELASRKPIGDRSQTCPRCASSLLVISSEVMPLLAGSACGSAEVTRGVVERTSDTLKQLVHNGRLMIVSNHVTFVANDINSVSVPAQCPPNWAAIATGNDTVCGRSHYFLIKGGAPAFWLFTAITLTYAQ